MMTDAISELSRSSGSLAIEADHDDKSITLRLVGEAGSGDTMAMLDEVFTLVHERASRAAVESVIVDIRGLLYMNSSSFKSLLTWVDSVRQLEPVHQYRARFVLNPAIAWQTRTLKSLQRFASEIVVID